MFLISVNSSWDSGICKWICIYIYYCETYFLYLIKLIKGLYDELGQLNHIQKNYSTNNIT